MTKNAGFDFQFNVKYALKFALIYLDTTKCHDYDIQVKLRIETNFHIIYRSTLNLMSRCYSKRRNPFPFDHTILG